MLQALEMFQIRPFLTGALNQWHKMATLPSTVEESRVRQIPARHRQGLGGGGGSSSSSSSAAAEGESGGAADDAPASTRKLRRFR
jgi:hypothetical protein